MPVPSPDPAGEDRPPLPLSWGQLYALVLAALAATILFLAWLTERFK